MALAIGDKLGPYELLSPIGAGGMGEVWKARDTRLNRIVAIKRLKGEHTARFQQEGLVPTWSPDGKELFFLAADQKRMSVQVKIGAKFEVISGG